MQQYHKENVIQRSHVMHCSTTSTDTSTDVTAAALSSESETVLKQFQKLKQPQEQRRDISSSFAAVDRGLMLIVGPIVALLPA